MQSPTPQVTNALRTGRTVRRTAAMGLAVWLALPVAAWHDGQPHRAPVVASPADAGIQQAKAPTVEEAAQSAAEAAVERARAAEEAARAAAEAARAWHVPVGKYYISSLFGEMRYSGPHVGLDFAGNDGVPVAAARNGVVTQVGWEGGYGFAVTVDHGDGYTTKYAHLAGQPLVAVGQQVVGGEHMGFVGSTGDSTGPHLHFEMLRNGQPIDPASVINIPPSMGIAAS